MSKVFSLFVANNLRSQIYELISSFSSFKGTSTFVDIIIQALNDVVPLHSNYLRVHCFYNLII